jgi:hypothetical protein
MNLEIIEKNIYYYKNVIENPEELVQMIEQTEDIRYQKYISKWEEWSACSGEHYVYGFEKKFKDIDNEDTNENEKNIVKKIEKTINDSFISVAEHYGKSIKEDVPPKIFDRVPIKKYKEGTSMGTHFDQQEGDDRLKYSFVMYLNDNYEGGEISFTMENEYSHYGELGNLVRLEKRMPPELDFDLADLSTLDFYIKPEPGSMIVFPSSPPYHHTAHLVKSGFKYMIPNHWIR